MNGAEGQAGDSAAQNAAFFDDNSRYAERIGTLDTYRNVRAALNPQIVGTQRLLDVGSGGVFEYDTALARQVVAVDLFFDGRRPPGLPANVILRRGDALALEEPDGAYDTVLHVSVFHHLIGRDVESTRANIRRAVAESERVLAPGGRLVVMESCVSAAAFAIERRLFSSLRLLAATPLMHHPATLQFPPQEIAAIMRERFAQVDVEAIPIGRWILQFGVKWPTALTPARPYLFVASR